MATITKNRIQKLEWEVQEIWRVISEDLFWHPSVIEEIKERARKSRKLLKINRLKTAGEVFSKR